MVISKASNLPKVIGGLFGLGTPKIDSVAGLPPFLHSEALLMVNARSCLFAALRVARAARTWMPSFLCPSVISAVKAAGSEICFYRVDNSLQVTDDKFLNELHAGDAFLFINFFGFPGAADIATRAREFGAVVIEDASQSLLTPPSINLADFLIYSPRKFLGVIDGGVLLGNCDLITSIEKLEPPNSHWLELAAKSAAARAKFDAGEGDNHWFEAFQWAEENAPIGHFRISELSRALLSSAFDYDAFAQARQRNFRTLLDLFPKSSLFKDLPERIIPLGFPMVISERDSIQKHLAEKRIYAPVHWRIDGFVPPKFENSHALSRSILTLPCDQRYDSDDMIRIANELNLLGIGE